MPCGTTSLNPGAKPVGILSFPRLHRPPIEGSVRAEVEGLRASQPPGESRPSILMDKEHLSPADGLNSDAPRRPWLSFGAPDAPIHGHHNPPRAASTRTRRGSRRVGRLVREGDAETESLAGYCHGTTQPEQSLAACVRAVASTCRRPLLLLGKNEDMDKTKTQGCGTRRFQSALNLSPSCPGWRNRHVSIPSGARAESLMASFCYRSI